MIVDVFGGPGGWAEGLRLLGLTEVGIELDPWACATRRAAGHLVVRADVTRFPLDHLAGRIEGLIASPPCQAFSAAGNGDGRAELNRLATAIERRLWEAPFVGAEVLQVGRWVEALQPRWIAAEQVPPVLPLWATYARLLRSWGYQAWAGILNAADFGVGQTRRRAILVASLDRPVGPPAPTHAKGGAVTLFGNLGTWVSMAEALGWVSTTWPRRDGGTVDTDGPAPTVCGHREPAWMYPVLNRRQQNPDGSPVPVVPSAQPAPTLTGIAGAKGQWIFERPATTVAGDSRLSGPGRNDPEIPGSQYGENSVRLSITDALILQSFRPDYPLAGTKTKQFEQVGNAVPPLLAAHIVAAVTGRTMAAEA